MSPVHDESRPSLAVDILSSLAALAILLTAAWVALQEPVPDALTGGAVLHRIHRFVWDLLFLGGIPFAVSFLFSAPQRDFFRALGMLGLSAFLVLPRMQGTPVARHLQEEELSHVQVGNPPSAREKAVEEMNDTVQKTRTEAIENFKKTGFYSADPQQMLDKMNLIKSQLAGDTSKEGRVILAEIPLVTDMVNKVMADRALEKTIDFKCATIKDQADLQNRRAAVATLRQQQQDMVVFLGQFDQRARDAMTQEGLSQAVVETQIKEMDTGVGAAIKTRLWQDKVQLSDDYLARFDFLAKAWGRWSVQNGQIIFQDSADAAAFNASQADMQKVVADIQSIQGQIIQATAPR